MNQSPGLTFTFSLSDVHLLLNPLQQPLQSQFRTVAVPAVARLGLRLLQSAADTLERLGLGLREVDLDPCATQALVQMTGGHRQHDADQTIWVNCDALAPSPIYFLNKAQRTSARGAR